MIRATCEGGEEEGNRGRVLSVYLTYRTDRFFLFGGGSACNLDEDEG